MNSTFLKVGMIVLTVIIVIAILGVLVGYKYASFQYQKVIAENENRAAEHYIELENKYRSREREHAEQIAEIDRNNAEKLKNVQIKNKSDLAAIAAGTLQLRDKFVCNADVPETGTSTSMGNGETRSGLRPEDAAFLVSESDRSDSVVIQLQACQEILVADRSKP